MNTNKNFTDNPIWNLIRENGPTIIGMSGLSILIMAAILNMAGFVSGLSFFTLFVLSFIIMLAAVGLIDDRRENSRRNNDLYST